uniref:NADH-ubiquinone oxidoreductase chain 1 n=1 Tax=Pseudogarypus banksi TaxID=1131925 RepID=H9MFJ4_9ARAC|nr:NADH dehydrogenase subunit 1 [Pseudogarypus banksi]
MIFLMVELMLGVLISVAFISLLERKILSLGQSRKGPNKALFNGIGQPFSDILKLFSKEYFKFSVVSMKFYYFPPLFMIILSFLSCLIFPVVGGFLNMLDELIIYYLCLISVSSYIVIYMGWLSFSKYSLLGSYRGASMIISYEVFLFLLILLMLIYLLSKGQLFNFLTFQSVSGLVLLIYFFYLMFMGVMGLVSELNRSPIDLLEGESELVSGFNTEYLGFMFSLIFMSEYLMVIMGVLFLSGVLVWFSLLGYFVCSLIIVMVVFFRAVYPRIRYDMLMVIFWEIILPFALMFFF